MEVNERFSRADVYPRSGSRLIFWLIIHWTSQHCADHSAQRGDMWPKKMRWEREGLRSVEPCQHVCEKEHLHIDRSPVDE